jgi:hypothetical protein
VTLADRWTQGIGDHIPNTYIYVKLGVDKKYYIFSMVEQHNHTLISPDIKLIFSDQIVQSARERRIHVYVPQGERGYLRGI